jgi:hypothetical protein
MEMEKTNWKEYVREQAVEYGVHFDAAWEIFLLLGPNEAYDGFVTELQDIADSGEFEDY